MITAIKKPLPDSPYEQAADFLPMFKDKLLALPPAVKQTAREIRLRAGQAIAVEHGTQRLLVNVTVTREDLKNLIELFCDYSLHSYARQFSLGFITLKGGHRAGFCGTAVFDDSRGAQCASVQSVRNITSINLRIAREFPGCSDKLFSLLPVENIKSLLLIGKPMSAKTTILRDFARNLSEAGFKAAVIDERSELSSSCGGAGGFNLGANTDVLDGFPKKAGFITALRALSPDFIICDEVTGDTEEIAQCLSSGVGVIMTMHCGSLEEARRSAIAENVQYIALLGTGMNIGKLQGLWRRETKNNEISFSNMLSAGRERNRLIPFSGA
jgi:stage III sporulation protein AA